MSQSVLQTELTDAVNSGIVENADKSEKSLKSGLYSVGKRASTGGAASAALAAVTNGRKGGKTGSADGGASPKGKAGKANAAMAHAAVHSALEGSELEGMRSASPRLLHRPCHNRHPSLPPSLPSIHT